MRQTLVFIDPLETLFPASDTSLLLIHECLQRNHRVAIADFSDLSIESGEVYVKMSWVTAATSPLTLNPSPQTKISLREFQIILVRKNPPYDMSYHTAMLMLELARPYAFICNDPAGLRSANEKLYTFQFAEFMAPTIVTQDIAQLREFMKEQGGQMVVKPLDGFGGSGIFHVKESDSNTTPLLEILAQQSRWVMAQQYLPAVKEGDKRIIVLDGEPVGALLRIPAEHDIRSNLRAGGQAHRTTIAKEDRLLCNKLSTRLREDGLYFVGLDVIGGYLTEVNVTSPTGVVVINRLENIHLEKRIVDFLEQKSSEL